MLELVSILLTNNIKVILCNRVQFEAPICVYNQIRGGHFFIYTLYTLVSWIIVQQNLILFWKKSILHKLIPSCTFINFGNFLAKTLIFTNKNWNFPSCTALFHPARLLIFGILPACTFIPSCTIIRETRVHLDEHAYTNSWYVVKWFDHLRIWKI